MAVSASSGTPTSIGEAYRGARVAVLGASGFIGRWVARALCAERAKVFALVRDEKASGRVFSEYRIEAVSVELNLTNFNRLKDVLREIQPHTIFNLAGYGVDPSERDRDTMFRVNSQLVQAIAEAAAECRAQDWPGQTLVHVGSALEYGAISGNLAEDSAPHPTTPYGRSKLAGTLRLRRACTQLQLPGLAVRLFTVYGPGEHRGRLLPSLLRAAVTKRPLRLTAGTQRRDFTYVEDVAEGLLRLGLTNVEPGLCVNLASGSLTSVREFAETAAAILNLPPHHLHFGALPTRAEEMVHSGVNIMRLRELTDWTPSTLVPQGIRRAVDFQRLKSSRS